MPRGNVVGYNLSFSRSIKVEHFKPLFSSIWAILSWLEVVFATGLSGNKAKVAKILIMHENSYWSVQSLDLLMFISR